jgi:hypothetical protein
MNDYEQAVVRYIENTGEWIEYLNKMIETQGRAIETLWQHVDMLAKIKETDGEAAKKVQAALAVLQSPPSAPYGVRSLGKDEPTPDDSAG